MSWFVVFIALLTVITALVAMVMTVNFARRLRAAARPGPVQTWPDERWPRVSIILCLRGSDPFLHRCLSGLFQQDYPDYRIEIVVDSADDPAHSIVRAGLDASRFENVRIQILEERLSSCSLKCSSLVQALTRLDDATEVVALVDADTVPHPEWLRELVRPLSDPAVGACSGNRWYVPGERCWGTSIRYLWNVAAVPLMYHTVLPWAGTLALKREAIEKCDLVSYVRRALCEDTMLFHVMGNNGFQVAFVPHNMMLNEEESALPSLYPWLVRQTLMGRLYHPHWFLINLAGLLTAAVPLLPFPAALLALATGRTDLLPPLLACHLLFQLSMFAFMVILETSVRRLLRQQSRAPGWTTLRNIPKLVVSLPVTQMISVLAFLRSLFVREIDWRGITYRIDGPWAIQIGAYRAYQPVAEPVTELQSL